MNLKIEEWYALDIKDGFVATFDLLGNYSPSIVYKTDKENVYKVCNMPDNVVYMSYEDLLPHATRLGIHCLLCDDVVFSCMRHHQSYCKCGNSFIDGGNSYSRYNLGKNQIVTINLLDKTITKVK